MSSPRWFVLTESGLAHAKEMGTGTSACGRAAGSWPRHWDQSFPPVSGPICPVCSKLVGHGTAAGTAQGIVASAVADATR